MDKDKVIKKKCPTIAGSSISENIHFDLVNGLHITTVNGLVNIDQFVCQAIKSHQFLIQKHCDFDCNDYDELDYSQHIRLLKKEFYSENDGGQHG